MSIDSPYIWMSWTLTWIHYKVKICLFSDSNCFKRIDSIWGPTVVLELRSKVWIPMCRLGGKLLTDQRLVHPSTPPWSPNIRCVFKFHILLWNIIDLWQVYHSFQYAYYSLYYHFLSYLFYIFMNFDWLLFEW